MVSAKKGEKHYRSAAVAEAALEGGCLVERESDQAIPTAPGFRIFGESETTSLAVRPRDATNCLPSGDQVRRRMCRRIE